MKFYYSMPSSSCVAKAQTKTMPPIVDHNLVSKTNKLSAWACTFRKGLVGDWNWEAIIKKTCQHYNGTLLVLAAWGSFGETKEIRFLLFISEDGDKSVD